MDALLPPEIAEKAEQVGVKKASLPLSVMFVLAVLAGAFIAMGGVFSSVVSAGADAVPYGITRMLSGLVFSLGLIMVVVGGAELFTGNNLMVMAWANGKLSTTQVLRNWLVVYVGNFAGALATALLWFHSGSYQAGKGAVGASILSAANTRLGYDFMQAVCLGILCNALVCMAVWLSMSARSTTDRILSVVPPVAAFVAAGFEHCVANMFSVPAAILVREGANDAFWSTLGRTPADYPRLTWDTFLTTNLLPVTLGNICGGALLVGAVYWFVYLRRR
ncbi:MAG: formate transporter FocA [Myxococcota bacterium]